MYTVGYTGYYTHSQENSEQVMPQLYVTQYD